eukprot:Nitzschia sp. Nitz4//scaffold258_size27474//2642//3034//NITZ4_008183-RA/size27474-processed-gene-0.0-mRNA-1//1//CDS//3329544479//8779//frame0
MMSSQQNARWERFEEDENDDSSTSSSMSLTTDRKRKASILQSNYVGNDACPYLPINTTSKREHDTSNVFEKTQVELLDMLHSTTSFLGKIDPTRHSQYMTPKSPMITFTHKRSRGEPSKDSSRFLRTSLE